MREIKQRVRRLEQRYGATSGQRMGGGVLVLQDGETVAEAIARAKAEGRGNGGFLIVPAPTPLDEWVKQARAVAAEQSRQLDAAEQWSTSAP